MERDIGGEGPLGLLIERFLGQNGTGQYISRGYSNWSRLHQIMTATPTTDALQDFMSGASDAQALSSKLLDEWWSASIQARDLSEAATQAILERAMSQLTTESDLSTMANHSLVREMLEAGSRESTYHNELFKLWAVEFCVIYDDDISDTNLEMLRTHRQDAAIVATTQRIAWSCFRQFFSVEGASDIPSSTHLKYPFAAIPEVCPWLGYAKQRISNHGNKKGLPHFLWDKKERRTIKVESLLELPSYIVISHTWGRWERQPPVEVIGVVDWLVPQNSRFDVTKLPEELERVPVIGGARYVWMDLLCIPQKSPPNSSFAEIERSEIDRQDEIFKNASCALMWLNEIPNWQGVQAAISWYAADFLLKSHQEGQVDPLMQFMPEVVEGAERATDLYDYQPPGNTDTPGERVAEPAGWFSSLWTLQEACLRPDMFLVNRDFRILTVGAENVVITLESLIALILTFDIHSALGHDLMETPLSAAGSYTLPPLPRAAAELHDLIYRCEFIQLPNATQMTILALANQRYCKHSPARAIMNAIGAKEWYERGTAHFTQKLVEENLVLGKFPLEFLNEIRQQQTVQARFFSNSASGGACVGDIYERDANTKRIIRMKPIGSMLPFAPGAADNPHAGADSPRHVIRFHRGSRDHESVRSWEIQVDGSVFIEKVGIVASHVVDPGEPRTPQIVSLFADVLVHVHGQAPEPQHVDLGELLQQYRPGFSVYAVSLCHGRVAGDNAGVILQQVLRDGVRVPPGFNEGAKLLVNVGTFRLTGGGAFEAPITTTVRWQVL